MSEKRSQSPLEIVSDEDWKSRVKAEDAQLDAQQREPASLATGEAEEGDGDGPPGEPTLPPASFGSLIQMLASQAIAALGLIPGPDGKHQAHIPVARHFIDLLAVLEDKCRGNMTDHEARGIEQTLHELRIAYVEISRREQAK